MNAIAPMASANPSRIELPDFHAVRNAASEDANRADEQRGAYVEERVDERSVYVERQ